MFVVEKQEEEENNEIPGASTSKEPLVVYKKMSSFRAAE